MVTNTPLQSQKVAFFLSSLDGGGAERVMLNLAEGFVLAGHPVDLVLGKLQGPYINQIPKGVKVVNLDKSRLMTTVLQLSRYLKAADPSLLISALEDTNIVAILARKLAFSSAPLIVTVHNYLSHEAANAKQLKRRLVPYLLRYFYLAASAVVGVSTGVVSDLLSFGVPPQRVTAIYNPIVSDTLFAKAQERPQHPWFEVSDTPIILGVGRLTRQKDFSTLIYAFHQVHQSCPARLLILGEGEDRADLESLVRRLGLSTVVSMPGFMPNPYSFMANADLLVMSSAWEGFGNVIVESLALGTPVVSTDCESGPAEILDYGRYGRLVQVGDVDGMARAILATLRTTVDRASLKSRAMDFSLPVAVSKYKASVGMV